MSLEPPLVPAGAGRVVHPAAAANKSTAGESYQLMSNEHPDNGLNDLFGEVISTYTDKEALDDGTLVDVGERVSFQGLPVNRMTRHLFDDLAPGAEAGAPLFNGDFNRALASILETKCVHAQGDPGNVDEVGDIYTIPPKLWLVRNEVAGWTAMYPEDY
jgi:hypothetical protein